MSIEFTGERVVPGRVDRDLWNEHFARYLFAARLCRHRRVLDLGCGAGYGSAELSRHAASVTALDIAPEAVTAARACYGGAPVRWTSGSAETLPFRDGSFDLVVAFEVIEHLQDQTALIREARRVLAPGGQFVVSTPNRLFYAESRKLHGPNPYHTHEYEFEEFRAALAAEFPHIAMFLEDHTEGILIQAAGARGATEVRFEEGTPDPQAANFFVAVCALSPQTGAPTYIYVPSAANLLRERALHIEKLEGELATKDDWLAAARAEHAELVNSYRGLKREVEEKNAWAAELDAQLATARARIEELERELRDSNEWAQRLDAELQGKGAELVQAVELLHTAERTVEERTEWAQRLDREKEQLAARVAMLEASRWVKLGRVFGLGPS